MHANHVHGEAGNVRNRYGRCHPTPEYQAWVNMRRRCENPRVESYPRYGGRGIRVCDQWLSYETFIADVGRRPSPKHSLDRIDPNGHYEPGNVRWATPAQQGANRSVNVLNAVAAVLIRELFRRGASRRDLAHAFDIRPALVSRVVKRTRWTKALEVLHGDYL